MQFNLTRDQKQYIYDCGAKSAREQIEKILGISDEIILEEEVKKPAIPIENDPEIENMVKCIVSADPKMIDSMMTKK
jgi:hypothetical protein